jgi:cyclase
MRRTRVIPALLLKEKSLVKTTRFKDPVYVGDPINTVRIFNDKEVDELVILDITATSKGCGPDMEFLRELTSECFMPLCYGGGIRNREHIEKVLKVGIEKVAINTMALDQPKFIKEAAESFGSQSIVVAMDVIGSRPGGYRVARTAGEVQATTISPLEHAIEMEKMGAGEILLNSVSKDGTGEGYDLPLIESVAGKVSIPVIACGGAGRLEDFGEAIQAGASAVAAGRMFVFHGKHRAVLISYTHTKTVEEQLS